MGREHTGLAVAGRCADLGMIDGEDDARHPALELDARARLSFAGVRLRGWPRGGIMVWYGDVTLADARITETGKFGAAASSVGADRHLRDVEVTALYTDVDGACVPVACGLGPWGRADGRSAAVHVVEGGDGDGTRAESLLFGRAETGLTVAGRCPERVVLDGADPGDSTGVMLSGAETTRVRVEGLTVRGFRR